MSVTGKFQTQLTGVGGALLDVVNITWGGVTVISEAIPAASNGLTVSAAFPISTLKGIYVKTDTAMTVSFYNGTTAMETIAFTATQPLVWHNKNYQSRPFQTTDVNLIKITAASSGTFDLQALYDPTA